jgi:glycosyltransferase involved in cell wall biosynthesis
MAAGLPVVYCEASESAVAELVRNDREGLCVTAEPSALARALSGLLEDEEECDRLGRNALARAHEYDWDQIAERVERMYFDLLSGESKEGA